MTDRPDAESGTITFFMPQGGDQSRCLLCRSADELKDVEFHGVRENRYLTLCKRCRTMAGVALMGDSDCNTGMW